MSNRNRSGNVAGDQYERAPDNWYCEGEAPVRQLMDAISFGRDLIWDPSCGRGNILDVAKARGHATVGSDIVDRHAKHRFYRGNFLHATRYPQPAPGGEVSIICNPPYGESDDGSDVDLAQRFARQAVAFPLNRIALLVPLGFLASQGRYRLFTRDCPPSHVAICSERPSMPPGHLIAQLGRDAFKGGRLDYCWVVWTRPHRWRTETVWLKPDEIA